MTWLWFDEALSWDYTPASEGDVHMSNFGIVTLIVGVISACVFVGSILVLASIIFIGVTRANLRGRRRRFGNAGEFITRDFVADSQRRENEQARQHNQDSHGAAHVPHSHHDHGGHHSHHHHSHPEMQSPPPDMGSHHHGGFDAGAHHGGFGGGHH